MQIRLGSTALPFSFNTGLLLYLSTLLWWNISLTLATPVDPANAAAVVPVARDVRAAYEARDAHDDLLIEEPADANRAFDDEETYWHWKRTEFPDYPPSCKLCERDYYNIDSCANASVPFANFSMVIFNPLSFIDIIQCACTDTFQSAYPQCVDCFTLTNQTGFLAPEDGNLSSIVVGMRQICALGSALFGGVATANSQLPGQTPITVTSIAAALGRFTHPFIMGENTRILLIGFATILTGILTGMWTVL